MDVQLVSFDKHHPGEKAYWSTLVSGLVPCKVLDVKTENGTTKVHVRITGKAEGFKQGEELWLCASRVFPRSKVKKHKLGAHLMANYEWAPTGEQDNG